MSEPLFVLTLTEWEAAIVERILHTFAETADYIPVHSYEDIATAAKFSWNLLEQAGDQGVEFPSY